jgi:hypothetical protein
LWSNETLDLGAADLVLLAVLLKGATNDILADIYHQAWRKSKLGSLTQLKGVDPSETMRAARTVSLGEVEELADLAGTLGSEAAWLADV